MIAKTENPIEAASPMHRDIPVLEISKINRSQTLYHTPKTLLAFAAEYQ